MATYRVLNGIEYNAKRVEIGESADDIPAGSLKWLVDQGVIELVTTNSGVQVAQVPPVVALTPVVAPAPVDPIKAGA